MATGLQTWSQTAASNANADANVNWAEGQAPSSVNDSARAEMASAAKFRDDNNGTLVTSGTTAAFTVATNQVEAALTAGYTVAIQFHATNDTSATLNVDGLGAKPLQINPGVNVTDGEYQSGTIHRFTYSTTGTGQWVEDSGIGVNSVKYHKIKNVSDNSLIGNVQGVNWIAQEIQIGTGLIVSTTSTSTSQSAGYTSTSTSTSLPFTLKAPQFPPPAAFKNLSIKVTGTSSANAAADFATLATSGSSQFQTLALSGSINFGANGAVNALDTGSLASGTWYAIWGIANTPGTSQGFLASTSFTSPTMPSSFTYKARLGAVVTSTTTASAQLMGTWQLGRQAQYVVGLAATTAVRIISNASEGSISAPTWVTKSTTNFVPQTASKINGFIWAPPIAAASMVAPNNSYGAYNSVTNPPPMVTSGSTPNGTLIVCNQFSMLLESSNIFAANNFSGSNMILACTGWEDNL